MVRLELREVQVVRLGIPLIDSHPPEFHLLSASEKNRAGEFDQPSDRSRFIWGRILLRKILAWQSDQDPQKLEFIFEKQGKPVLKMRDSYLEFNLSHSESFIVLAIARGMPVGVDIEWKKNPPPDFDQLEHFFSSPEIDLMKNAKKSESQNLFYRFWSRKEAFLKAKGLGISDALSEIDTIKNPMVSSDFHFMDIEWDLEYSAAIVTDAECIHVQLNAIDSNFLQEIICIN